MGQMFILLQIATQGQIAAKMAVFIKSTDNRHKHLRKVRSNAVEKSQT